MTSGPVAASQASLHGQQRRVAPAGTSGAGISGAGTSGAGTLGAGTAAVAVFATALMIYGLGFLLTGAVSPWLWGAPFWRVGLDLLYAIAGFAVARAWFAPAAGHRLLVARGVGLYAAYAACIAGTVAVIGPLATRIALHDYLHSPVTRLYLHALLFRPAMFLPGAFAGLEWNSAVNPVLFQARPLAICMVVLASLTLVSPAMRAPANAACGLAAAASYLVLFAHPAMQPQLLGVDAREITVEIPFFCAGAVLARWDARAAFWRADVAMLAFLANWVASSWFVQWDVVLEWATLPYMAACVGRSELPGAAWLRARLGDPTAGLFLFSFPIQQLVVLRLPGHLAHGILLCAAASLAAALACFHLVERPVQHVAALLLAPGDRDAAQ